MGKRLTELEFAQIHSGNSLFIPCQGEHDCGGALDIPFKPGIDGAPDGKPLREGGPVWTRDSGTTLADLTLSPSINAYECGHFHVKDGQIV